MTEVIPKKPNPEQFEAAVAAIALCYGYFIETRHTLRSENKREIMELDVLASRHREKGKAQRTLIEAKSSEKEPVFNAVFKLGGQVSYLDIPSGHLVIARNVSEAEHQLANTVGRKLGISVNRFNPNASPEFGQINGLERLTSNLNDEKLSKVYSIAWHQQIAERICAQALQHKIKSHPDTPPFAAIKRYQQSCESSLFEVSPLQRLLKLHDAFTESPKLFDLCVNLIAKNDEEKKLIKKQATQTHEHKWIQYAMSLELRAKLLAIKCCFEHIEEHGGNWRKALDSITPPQTLPARYVSSMQTIAAGNYHPNCPYILQVFIELLGGFIVDSNDYEFLEAISGADRPQVLQALQLFDTFFPMQRTWYFDLYSVKALKLTPAYSRGIGAFFRKHTRDDIPYSDLTPSGDYSLGVWHNAAYYILESDPKLKL